jgi:hypothetical protein
VPSIARKAPSTEVGIWLEGRGAEAFMVAIRRACITVVVLASSAIMPEMPVEEKMLARGWAKLRLQTVSRGWPVGRARLSIRRQYNALSRASHL